MCSWPRVYSNRSPHRSSACPGRQKDRDGIEADGAKDWRRKTVSELEVLHTKLDDGPVITSHSLA